MDVTGNFFQNLRTLALTLEKQTKQLKQIFHNETAFEDDSPVRYLHEMYSDIKTLKGDIDNILSKSSSERDITYDFIKTSRVLMKRNATDLGEIRELFQKYGYKPLVVKDTAINAETETNPTSTMFDHKEPKDLDCSGKSSGPFSPQQIPQLSDYGLSKYALPSTNRKEDSECLSPKAEHFHIHGRNLLLNDETTSIMEDQTIFLLNNAKNIRQANKLGGLASNKSLAVSKQTNQVCDEDYMASPASPQFCTPGVKIPRRKETILPKSPTTNSLDVPSHTPGKPLRDSQSLQTELKIQQVDVATVVSKKELGKVAGVPVLYSDEHLECEEEPCSPGIPDYSNLLNTPPPPPEITVIPKQIFQILSKYNPKIEAPRSLEKGTKEGQVKKSSIFDIGNKENWKYSIQDELNMTS